MTYDEYTVYVTLPEGVHLDDVIKAGMVALGHPADETLETDFRDTHEA